MKNTEKPGKKPKEYSIIIKKSALKFLDNLDDKTFGKIDEKIISLKINPHPNNSKKLIQYNCYRVRVGDYRILYNIDTSEYIITVLDIDYRKDVYKKK